VAVISSFDQSDVSSLGAQIADVGANRGLHALYLRSLVGAGGAVHMFEPNPMEHEHLAALAGRYTNLHFHPYGLSSKKEDRQLHVPVVNDTPVSTRGTLRDARGVMGEEVHLDVNLRRLDDVAPLFPRPLDVIKCDVEGFELEVLRGALRTLGEHHPVLVVEIEKRHCDDQFDAVFDLIGDLDYDGWFFRSGRLVPLRLFDLREHQLSYYESPASDRLPPGYVRDFLFVPRRNTARLLNGATTYRE
jgi:FkbM family methyltransferase